MTSFPLSRALALVCLLLLSTLILATPLNSLHSSRHLHPRPTPAPPTLPTSTVSLTVDTASPGIPVSRDLYGVFFEEISHAGVGGLYSQAIFNSNFETNVRGAYAPWTAVPTSGVDVELSLTTDMPLTPASPHSLRVVATPSQGESDAPAAATVGVVNPGFWGIHVPASTSSFNVSFFAYSASSTVMEVTASLTNTARTTVYGMGTFQGVTSSWKHFSGVIATSATTADPHAVLTLTWSLPSSGPASINFDIVTAFPLPGWRGLPFIRADIADTLAALRPSILRMPGGGYVDGNTLAQRFAWNNTIGPLQNRTGHSGSWGYYSEDGLGIFEYFSFAEQLRDVWDQPTRTVWVINVGISNAQSVPVAELGPWVQSALDCLEFITGAASTHYGGIRAAMGHPAPFKLDYYALGNENVK